MAFPAFRVNQMSPCASVVMPSGVLSGAMKSNSSSGGAPEVGLPGMSALAGRRPMRPLAASVK